MTFFWTCGTCSSFCCPAGNWRERIVYRHPILRRLSWFPAISKRCPFDSDDDDSSSWYANYPKKRNFFKVEKSAPPPFFLADNCVVKKPAQKGNWPFFFLVVFLFFQLFWWRIEKKNKKEFLPFRERVTFFLEGKTSNFHTQLTPTEEKENKKQKIIAANGVCGKCVNLNLSNHFFLYFFTQRQTGFFKNNFSFTYDVRFSIPFFFPLPFQSNQIFIS